MQRKLVIAASEYEFIGVLRERMKREAEYLQCYMDAEQITRLLGTLETWRHMVLAVAPDGYREPSPLELSQSK